MVPVSPQRNRISTPSTHPPSGASTITVAELTLKGQLIASSTFKYTSVLSMVAALYLVMSVPLILFVGWLERSMHKVKP